MAGPPLTSPSPTDQQPALWVLSFLYTIYAVGVLGVRFGLRRKFQRSDQVLMGAYLLGLINWALLWIALSKGLGKATFLFAADVYPSISRLVYSGIMILLLAQTTTMVSQCLFIGEHVSSTQDKRACNIAAGLTGVLGVASLLSTVAGCSGSTYLNTGAESCSHQSTRWIVAVILLAINSCVPGALSIYAFHRLQTRLTRKINLYFVFSSAVLNIPLLGGIASTAQTYFAQGRNSLDSSSWLVCLQTLLLLSFISASMPCARPLALKFTTAGLVLIDEAISGNTIRTANTLRSGHKSTRRSVSRFTNTNHKSINEAEPIQLRNDGGAHFNEISGGGDDEHSIDSFGSEQHVIRKTVETEVAVEITSASPPTTWDAHLRNDLDDHMFAPQRV